jgi:hypothetical protein|nr:hypothetical protein [uncultured Prevotella sp.]DAV55025.1 MAG TPA: hypothetical protein [Caudoviricetes sp.]
MKDIKIRIFDGSELILIAAALINVKHPIPEQGENALTTKDDVYRYILTSLANHNIKCHDSRNFSDKLYNYENEPCKEKFECSNSVAVKSIVLYLDKERSTGDDVVCVSVIFRD